MTELTYHEARARSILRALDADPQLVVIGGEIAFPFNPEFGLNDAYAHRVLWPPISEFANLAAATGAAMSGLRTLIPLATSSFMFNGWAAIVQEAANARYLSGGRVSVPMAVHLQSGARRSGAAQHEHTPQAMLQNVPGLILYQPGTPAEIDSAFHLALTADDPTLIFDHVLLIDSSGPVSEGPAPLVPSLVRDGGDALIVASGLMVQYSLRAAAALETEGVSVAVLSNPLISPAPVDTVLEHLGQHTSVVFVDESRGPGSPTSYLMSVALQRGIGARVRHVCSGMAPSPFALHLLDEVIPTADRIAGAVRGLLDPGWTAP